MSFLFGTAPHLFKVPERTVSGRETSDADAFYKDLIEQRPALLDEKLKLHARIIDEFNLTALEKLPRERARKAGHAPMSRATSAPRRSRSISASSRYSRKRSSTR